MSITVKKQTGTANTTPSPGRTIKYFAIHYTAGVSSKAGSARGCASWFANPSAGGAADYIVDEEEFIQYNPDPRNRYCSAVGGGRYNTKGGRLYGVATNANCVSLEICSTNTAGEITYPNDPRYSFTNKVLDKAVEAAKYIMELYGIDADHVIRHYDVNGKPCPGIIGWNKDSGNESKWEEFHARIGGPAPAPKVWYRVRLAWDRPETQVGAYEIFDNAKAECDRHPGFSVYDESGTTLYISENPSPGKYPSGIPVSKEQFIADCGAIAREIKKETGILAQVVTAQCCLETGFGLGADAMVLTEVSNLLGMKTDLINSTWKEHSVWGGESISKPTIEYRNGKPYTKMDSFRKYRDYANCIRDYEMFLLYVKNDKGFKYRRIQGWTDPAQVIRAIRIGTGTDKEPEGYCTDPDYKSKIMKLIKEYNLQQYDDDTPAPAPGPAPEPEPGPSGKVYRVQVGVYKRRNNAENRASYVREVTKYDNLKAYKERKKKTREGYPCFIEEDPNGQSHVYCGSFSVKTNADKRVQELFDLYEINNFVKEV